MRFHLIADPNTITTRAYELDGFCQRTILFAELLKRLGHEIVLYGVGAGTDAPCDEFVSCLSTEEYGTMIGGRPYQDVPFDGNTPLYATFNHRAGQRIQQIKHGRDVIALLNGGAHVVIREYNPELSGLEYSIGYKGVTEPYRIFQSYAWRHTVHGFTGIDGGRTFDAVIPPWFRAQDFPVGSGQSDYVIYCGRLTRPKGLAMVCRAAQAAGVGLVVIGHGDRSLVTYGDYLGAVSTLERNRLMAGARACLMPTQYLEPFGNVSAEAQLCGTPVISTDFGAFVESVEHGQSGYRCSTLGEFVQAIDLSRYLDRGYVRARAGRLYGEDAAATAYMTYFRRLALAQGHGWDTLEPTLDALPASMVSALEGVA